MTQSMTGYGRGEHNSNRYQFGTEIRSTNHRYLEVKVRFPRELIALENDVRGFVRSRFSRGYIDVQAFLGRPSAAGRRFVVDRELLAQVASGLQEAGRGLNLEAAPDLAVLSRFRELFSFEEEPDDLDELRDGLMRALENAVAGLEKSREEEGAEIFRSISKSMETFKGILGNMEEQAPAVSRRLAESLRTKLDALLESSSDLSPERYHQEAALLAAKSDVTEELERLRGHFGAFSGAMDNSAGPTGRKMDFLLQEMNRELNTTAAKAGTLDLSHLAIEGKLELEKIREQVQNLE